MNEAIDYAQMLEIPVSTVSVVKKRSLFPRKNRAESDVKERVVESVNERVGRPEEQETGDNVGFVIAEELADSPKHERKKTVAGKIIVAEAVAACALAAGIFLTNVFMPSSAINTFVGGLTAPAVVEKTYSDFTLTSVVSELSDAEVAVTDEGVIHFTGAASVYPVCDGRVASVSESEGKYTVKIAHTKTFSSVISGLDDVYLGEGAEAKSNLPFAYSKGESEVKICMYDGDALLNSYTLSGAVPVWNA